MGYGLVSGINGDGDKNPNYTQQAIANLMQRFGLVVPPPSDIEECGRRHCHRRNPALLKVGLENRCSDQCDG